MERALSAPGKVFLAGEYAVLWGGVARVAAVAPRLKALVRRRADREVHLVLEQGRLVGWATPLGVNWDGPVPKGFLFAARALDLAFRLRAREAPGLELAISPSPKGPGSLKLGLGGSASAAVLSSEAARYVLEERFDALKLALLSHRVAQDGKGSGADVAAIFAGGLVRYRRFPLERLSQATRTGQLQAALASSAPVDLLRLPPVKVELGYAFAGESVSTPGMIESIERQVNPAAREQLVHRSDALGSLLEQSLLQGDFPDLKEAVGELERLLAGLGPVESEAHRTVIALAESYGCAAKIAGSGGGDGCVLFAPDRPALDSLLVGLSERGFYALPLTVEAGLRGEAERDPVLARWLV